MKAAPLPFTLSLLKNSLAAVPLILLTACGGGSGGGDSTTTPLVMSRPVPNENCPIGTFVTYGGQCLSNDELAAKATADANHLRGLFSREVARRWRESDNPIAVFLQVFASRTLDQQFNLVNWHEGIANLALVRGAEESQQPGKGVTIGFMNGGIDAAHPVFNDNSGTITTRVMESSLEHTGGGIPTTVINTGTAQVSIAAGGIWGARGADINIYAYNLSDSDGRIRPGSGNIQHYPGDDMYEILADDLDILMNPFDSRNHNIEDYTENQIRGLIFDGTYAPQHILSLAQPNQSENKTILVWSAGRGGNTSPGLTQALHARIPELSGHSITVVSVDENGVISDFSNRCGIAAAGCIAAPGEVVVPIVSDFSNHCGITGTTECISAPGENGAIINSDGSWDIEDFGVASDTSFAASMVTGGLAIMKHVFRDSLTNEQLVSRLFTTAKDDGIHGDSSIYGHGLMDLGAATSPWGIPGFMGTGSSTTNSAPHSLSETSLSAGSAMGDAFSTALGGKELATFDSLGAPFWLDAGQFTVDGGGTTLAASLDAFMKPTAQPLPESWQFALNNPSLKSGHMTSIPHGEQYFHVSGPDGVGASFYGQGLEVSWNLPELPFFFRSGYIKENDSLLGSEGQGMFNQLGADTLYLGAGWDVDRGLWTLSATGEVGQVKPSFGTGGFIDDISPLTTSAFRFMASRQFDNGNTLRFALSQPLRVDQGSMDFTLPSGSSDGVVTGSSHSAHLAPTGRQLDLTTALDLPLGEGELSLGFTMSNQPRHQKGAGTEVAVFTGYRATW